MGGAGGKLANVDRGELLDGGMVSVYKSLIARANDIVPDRLDLAFTVEELARRMASPTKLDWENLCRMARYLAGLPRLRLWFQFQEDQPCLVAYSDSDWACCPHTRRSSSGGAVVRGSSLSKSWSKTQMNSAMSSAEAELYSSINASAECRGGLLILEDC